MARQIQSRYKPCRRYGIDFWNMNIPKNILSKPPGNKRKTSKMSLYKQQLMEKQKLYYYYYGISNSQMRSAYKSAIKTTTPKETFIYLIESRLHAYIMRNSTINSPFIIKQMIKHGRVLVNGNKCQYKSYRVRDGDILEFGLERLAVPADYSKSKILFEGKPMPFKPEIQLVLDYFKR